MATPIALIAVSMLTAIAGLAQRPGVQAQLQPPAEKRPDAARARHLDDTRLARATLYRGYDEASMRTGESFTSPSLGLTAADMVLRDFNLSPVPQAQSDPIVPASRFVAAALLKPLGFPASYTLLEVAVLQRDGAGGMQLLENLKVRVDSGTGAGELSMQLGAVPPPTPGSIRFDVVVSGDGRTLRHRFRHGGTRLVLLDSVVVD